MYVHYIDPHSPYIAAGQFYNYFDKDYTGAVKGTTEEIVTNRRQFKENRRDLEHLVALYDEEIRYVDTRFQRIIGRLRELDMLDRSIVIFLSDHGEGFLEHGRLFHSYGVYSELINVLLIIRYPQVFEAGCEGKYVQHIDIFPTICDILDYEVPDHIQGESVISIVKNKKRKDPEIYFESLTAYLNRGWAPLRGFIRRDLKFIDLPIKEVYNIEKDLNEKENLAEDYDLNKFSSQLKKIIKKNTGKYRVHRADKIKSEVKVEILVKFDTGRGIRGPRPGRRTSPLRRGGRRPKFPMKGRGGPGRGFRGARGMPGMPGMPRGARKMPKKVNPKAKPNPKDMKK